MKTKDKKRNSRIGRLVIIFALTAVIISVSTYAWFIGMRTVNVNSFDVEIASVDSLLLSLDGETWDTTIDINETNFDTDAYAGNTNTWGGQYGLTPVSTVGKIDTAVSRLELYEKASLTATAGGYRFMASRVENTGASELDGYVAFDLFIKNFSGRQYLDRLQYLDEEAIYLTTDSKVSVAAVGGQADVGIENTVRVAFAEIGRVSGSTTDPLKITGINCNPDGLGVPSVTAGELTGICRTSQIWEPNDIDHEADAINYYQTSCKKRTGLDITDKDSYTGNFKECGAVVQGTSYDTYAINAPVASGDYVDVYDGADYNGYTSSTKLTAYPYFTDTMKTKTKLERQEFITLAPNSITKVRVYVYLEGQDIDNYNFSQIGKRISVKFGFTKERINPDDIGATIPVSTDSSKPVITLLGSSTVNHPIGTPYVDAGATAEDDQGALGIDDLTRKIQVINPVDINVAGTYTITYNVSDWSGNYAAQVTRKVIVG